MTRRQSPPPVNHNSTVGAPSSTEETTPVRLDKWLWATRVYKTRSDANEACRGSAVRLNGSIAKPSSKVRIGDTIIARTKALTRTLYIVGLTDKRVGAALLPNYFEDRTPDSEYDTAREKRENARAVSYRGEGRPTKKDRRAIDRLNTLETDL